MESLPIDFFGIVQIMIPVFIILFIGTIIFLNIKEMLDFHYSNKRPVLTVSAKVVSKRTQVIHHLHQIEIHYYYPTSTYYFILFELDNGESMEFETSAIEYSSICKGDYGKLTYQGKVLLQFTKMEDE